MVILEFFSDLFSSYLFLSFIIAWASSILFKSLYFLYKGEGFCLANGLRNGGMPSSHATAVSSITVAVVISTGLSPLFFVCLVFSLIIISDAFRLRYSVGLQAESLNKLLKKSKEKPIEVIHGHTFLQVICGMILGSVVAGILYFII